MPTPIPTPADLLASNLAATEALTPAERAEVCAAGEATLAAIARRLALDVESLADVA